MRIDFLTEYEFPKIQTKIVKSLPDQYNKQHHGGDEFPPVMKRSKDVEHLGTGSFASAYSHKDRPGDVRKISTKFEVGYAPPDSFWNWIEFLSKHEHNDNPYFPRFRQITVYKNEKNDMVYSVQVERLQSLDKLSQEQLDSVYHKIWGENYRKAAKTASRMGLLPDANTLDKYHLSAFVKQSITKSNIYELAVDEEFKQAAAVVKEFISWSSDAYLDLHHENIMVRTTPYGAHLVLSDPVA